MYEYYCNYIDAKGRNCKMAMTNEQKFYEQLERMRLNPRIRILTYGVKQIKK